MDLKSILEKTKKTSDRVERVRKPVYIATEDRPYDASTESKSEEDSQYLFKKSPINKNQSDNKPVTNWQQSDNKLVTNYQQSSTDKIENYQQSDNKSSNKLVTNYQQSSNKVVTK